MIRNVLLAAKGLLKVTRISKSRGEEVKIANMHPYWCINRLKEVLNSIPANHYEELIENEEVRALCFVIMRTQKSDIRKSEMEVCNG